MNSDDIAYGIIKAVLVIVVAFAVARFFSAYPLLLILVIAMWVVGAIAIAMVKDMGIVRTALRLILLGGIVSFGWGAYFYDGKAGLAIWGGLVAIAVTAMIDDILKMRRPPAATATDDLILGGGR